MVPPGCMLYATNELLTSQKACEHRHGAQGLSVSFVIEVACENMPVAATPEAIAAAAAARAGLPARAEQGRGARARQRAA